ncbi:MAG: hypothetical protein A2Z06_02705 [Candidatus Glassbacteria bacterium RBG_16_58_8]|uniref:Uncharacterized protein n=1 Tax=Candidatus Glassbacteria bacterium RBG_16_58_8 TaxID=1817866 RepID=A0A1F5YDD8_9BACT|nr:MAG: hypothetical protein A2Z06_02705 [Candidatus Glassbacteria bacterium RBG_16_58_8]
MKQRFLLFVVALTVMALSGMLRAETARFSDRSCMGCHETGLELGFKVIPRVDTAEIQGSVHQGMSCVTCHRDIQAIPHEGEIGTVDCRECHSEEFKKYSDSVHGRAYIAKGELDAPSCADCHGKHLILSPRDPGSIVFRSRIPETCATCHENMGVVERYDIKAESPYFEYSQSVHGRALLRDGLVNFAAVCTDCHGIHEIEGEGAIEVSAHQPATCGRCHMTIYEVYRESIHGIQYAAGNSDAAVCVSCHGEHGIQPPDAEASPVSPGNITNTCSGCHESERMVKYDISSDKLKTYKESYHGVAHELGSLRVANCASCHGYHDILPSSDPSSSIHVSNIPATCGQCHTRTSVNFTKGKVHVDIGSKESGVFYYIRKAFYWLFAGLVAVSVIWLIADIRRRLKEKRGT